LQEIRFEEGERAKASTREEERKRGREGGRERERERERERDSGTTWWLSSAGA